MAWPIKSSYRRFARANEVCAPLVADVQPFTVRTCRLCRGALGWVRRLLPDRENEIQQSGNIIADVFFCVVALSILLQL
jgi:hypothetical protein